MRKEGTGRGKSERTSHWRGGSGERRSMSFLRSRACLKRLCCPYCMYSGTRAYRQFPLSMFLSTPLLSVSTIPPPFH